MLLISDNGKLARHAFAYLDELENFTFKFQPGFDDATVYPGILPWQNTGNITSIVQCCYRWYTLGWNCYDANQLLQNWACNYF